MMWILLVVFLNHFGSATEKEGFNYLKKSYLSSLVFVFDVTGSMFSELDQVKLGATKILKELTDKENNNIYDYVLVPFNDPEVGPSTKSTNATVFKSVLEDLKVNGGTDCPEMSLTAINESLALSLPGSFIFVFTDADPKDVHLLPEIVSSVRNKNSQVIFVLTGNCVEGENSKEFIEIASVSTGQIFNILKNDVHLVLDFIRLSLESRRINLLAIDNYNVTNCVEKFHIPVDETINDIVFSLSGKNIILTIVDPAGRVLNDSGCGVSLHLNTIRICSVQNPKFGIWEITVSSVSFYSLRTTGSTNMNFIYGFQTQRALTFNDATRQPFFGIENFILLQPKNSSQIFSLTTCEILSLDGILISSIPLEKVENTSTLYVGSFFPASKNVHIKIRGITKFGYLFQRITASAVYPSSSVINVTLTHTNLLPNQPLNITCVVYSSVPFKMQLFRNDADLNVTKHFSKGETVSLSFPKSSVTDGGNFSCVVTYKGNHTKFASINVQRSGTELDLPEMNNKTFHAVKLLENEDYALPCTAKGVPIPVFRWFYNKSIEITDRMNNEHQVLLPDNTFLILNSQLNQTGQYSCVAAIKFRSDEHYYSVTVTSETENDPSISHVKVMEGRKVVLSCPESKNDSNVQWLKNNSPLNMKVNERADEPHYVLTNGAKNLRILNVYGDDSGLYSCLISNINESSLYHFFLHVLIIPSFLDSRETIKIFALTGENVTLDCSVDGNPRPYLTWQKSNLNWPVTQWTLPNASFENLHKQVLHIYQVNEKDHAGRYECIAENELGIVRRYIELEVKNTF